MRDQLEADLERAWTRENLAVYADVLQSEGDPRGEWIAMDLAILRDGLDAATQQRRDALLEPYRSTGFTELRYGYGDYQHEHGVRRRHDPPFAPVDLLNLQPMFEAPLGPYLRGLTLVVPHAAIANTLAIIAEAPRPTLHRLSIVLDRMPPSRVDLARAVSDEIVADLVAATPNLRALELRAENLLFTSFVHPRIPDGPISRAHVYRSRIAFPKLEVQIGDAPIEIVETNRLARMHLGIVDELDAAAREAWADLRFAIEFLEDPFGDPLASPAPFPGEILDRVIATAVSVPLYGADWKQVAKLRAADPGSVVRLRRV